MMEESVKNIYPSEFGEKSKRCKDWGGALLKASRNIGGQANPRGCEVNGHFIQLDLCTFWSAALTRKHQKAGKRAYEAK